MKIRILFYILFMLGGVISIAAQVENPSLASKNNSSLQTKVPAPNFNLITTDGKKFELSALHGKIIVLNFWFTGCGPCIAEMPKLNELVNKFKRSDVVFIAPTWDKANLIPPFLKKHPFKYRIAPSAMSLILKTCSDGKGNIAMPTNMIIDADGNIEMKIQGTLIKEDGNTQEFENFVNALTRLVNNLPKKPKVKTKV